MTVGDHEEFDLVAWIRRRVPPPGPEVVIGIGDDAAVLRPPRGELLVVTTDTLVDGVHVERALCPPETIGRRAVAVNLSDLAAMGARPQWLLLSLAVPPSLPLAHFEALVDGAIAAATAAGAALVGGNLTRTPGPLTVDVTAAGRVHPRRLLRRDTARPGDVLWVTGALGGAAAGLAMLRAGAAATGPSVDRYLTPVARLREGAALAGARAARAALDVSDGLASSLRQLAAASNVGVRIDAERVPLVADARSWFERAGVDPLVAALAASDDYELLIASPPRSDGRIRAARRRFATPLTAIGVVTKSRECVLVRDGVAHPLPHGFAHFAGRPG
ncbi:MAG: thiamine-phosphate kinase [Vicinamibacterales bacterium]